MIYNYDDNDDNSIESLHEEINKLRRERDEARREVMSWIRICRSEVVDEEYEKRGWEYLKKNNQ